MGCNDFVAASNTLDGTGYLPNIELLHFGHSPPKRPGRDHNAKAQQGKMVEVTLQFDKAGTVKIEFPVAAIRAAAPGTPSGDGHMMEGHGGMMQTDKHWTELTDGSNRPSLLATKCST